MDKKSPKTYSARYVEILRKQNHEAWEAHRTVCRLLSEASERERQLQKANDLYHEHLKYVFKKSLEFHKNDERWNLKWFIKEIPKLMHKVGRMELYKESRLIIFWNRRNRSWLRACRL